MAYPATARPRLALGDWEYEVLDCSERGLRYRCLRELLPEPGTELRGMVRFPRGAEAAVEGAVLRVQGDEVAVLFTATWIPRAAILDEQRYLRGRYPAAE